MTWIGRRPARCPCYGALEAVAKPEVLWTASAQYLLQIRPSPRVSLSVLGWAAAEARVLGDACSPSSRLWSVWGWRFLRAFQSVAPSRMHRSRGGPRRWFGHSSRPPFDRILGRSQLSRPAPKNSFPNEPSLPGCAVRREARTQGALIFIGNMDATEDNASRCTARPGDKASL